MQQLLPLGGGIKIYVSDIHRFGTDAILLADFAAPRAKDTACDLGTGCGIIPLLWCRSAAPLKITAVDIQPDACELLNMSVEANGLFARVSVINADLRERGAVGDGYDLVTMNPPYKPSGDGKKCSEDGRRIARHEDTCTLGDLAGCAARILKFGGRLCFCQRPDRLCDAVESMRSAGLEPKRLRLVCQRAGSAPSLMLLECKKGAKPGLSVMPTLIIENDSGAYSPEMQRIYAEYESAKGEKNEHE